MRPVPKGPYSVAPRLQILLPAIWNSGNFPCIPLCPLWFVLLFHRAGMISGLKSCILPPGGTLPSTRQPETRLKTGMPGLDDILHGGLPAGHLYLIEGNPGSGKTTFGMQFLLAGIAAGERALYVTLAESQAE